MAQTTLEEMAKTIGKLEDLFREEVQGVADNMEQVLGL